MRLIDADILINAVAESFAPYQREWAETIHKIAKVIENQPTAYNVNKVVEQLEELKEESLKLWDGNSRYKGFTQAIEIVKEEGGVDA